MRAADGHVSGSAATGLHGAHGTGRRAEVLPCHAAELGLGSDKSARRAALAGSDGAEGASLGGVTAGAQALSSLPMRIVDRGVERLG